MSRGGGRPWPRRIAGPDAGRVHTLFFVETAVLYGGPQKRLFRLARGWRERGHPSAVAALRGDEASDPDALARFGIPVLTLTGGGKEVLKSHRIAAARAARRLVDRLRPELVVTMESLVDHQVRLGLLGTRVPVVTLLGIDRWRWERRPHRVWLARRLASRPGAVVGNSRRCLDGWRRVLGDGRFARLPSAVLPNPVDPAELEPRFPREEGEQLLVGGLGRFARQKGFDLLVDAFARLPERVRGRPVRLALQGRGPDEPELRARIDAHGLGARAEIRPFSSDVQSFLHEIDVLVVPSRWAGLENVALEGILAGTPILCTRGTGLDELPPDESLPLLEPDAAAIARALEAALALSPGERAAAARARRSYLLSHLDLHVVAERLESFLAGAGLVRPAPARPVST